MPSVFDLLDEIEKRPGIYLGWSTEQRHEQLRDLETLLMGYGDAVERHGIDDPGGDLITALSRFLQERYGWMDARGPFAAIRAHALTDEEAWQNLWRLIREFRTAVTDPARQESR